MIIMIIIIIKRVLLHKCWEQLIVCNGPNLNLISAFDFFFYPKKVLENFRKSKPRLHNMNDIAATLMKSGRLDEENTDELERVINVIVAKWESIDSRLNASRDR